MLRRVLACARPWTLPIAFVNKYSLCALLYIVFTCVYARLNIEVVVKNFCFAENEGIMRRQ